MSYWHQKAARELGATHDSNAKRTTVRLPGGFTEVTFLHNASAIETGGRPGIAIVRTFYSGIGGPRLGMPPRHEFSVLPSGNVTFKTAVPLDHLHTLSALARKVHKVLDRHAPALPLRNRTTEVPAQKIRERAARQPK